MGIIDDTSFELVKESKSIRNDGGSSGATSGYDVVDVDVGVGDGSVVGVSVVVGSSEVVSVTVTVEVDDGWVGEASVVSSWLHPTIKSDSMAIMRRKWIQCLLL